MNLSLRITLIIALIIYFLYIHQMLKRKKLELKYSLFWIFAGIIMLFFVIFPKVLELIAMSLGIINYLNGLYSAILFGIIILLMYLTMLVSEFSGKYRKLVQESALLEQRIRELEKQIKGETRND